jgi:hypothetical protein
VGRSELVNIRPERIRLHGAGYKPEKDVSSVEGVVIEVAYTGANTITIIENSAGVRLISTQLNEELPGHKDSFVVGDKVVATWCSSHVATIPQ